MALTVTEGSRAYERSMRNMAPPGPTVCPICWTFKDPEYSSCHPCSMGQPSVLDAVVPITYSEDMGQMHLALRNYKDGAQLSNRRFAMVRLAAILWRFLEAHEACVAAACGCSSFDVATVVPSTRPDPKRAERLFTLARLARPVKSRLRRTLRATGAVAGREYSSERYEPTADVGGKNVLLLDDTWTAGGHAQSAAMSLVSAGASTVALVVIGRHVKPEWRPVQGEEKTSKDYLDELPVEFDWDSCAVHLS